LVDSRACYLSRIRYNNQLALRCISNQTCSSITREAFFTFLGERVAVVKKHRASICDLKSAESAAFFFTGFIQEMFSPVQELGGRASSFHSADSVFAVQQTGEDLLAARPILRLCPAICTKRKTVVAKLQQKQDTN